jgi:hypothetical protein
MFDFILLIVLCGFAWRSSHRLNVLIQQGEGKHG